MSISVRTTAVTRSGNASSRSSEKSEWNRDRHIASVVQDDCTTEAFCFFVKGVSRCSGN